MVNEESNVPWNCGDNLTVENISTKANLLAWIGDITKCIPSVIFSFHFSNSWSADKGQDNIYTGQMSG